jgi:HNH endonuclease
MAQEISARLRRVVEERANYRCEYCRLPQEFAIHPHEPDHVIPVQHDGITNESNLALACFRCNRHKGPNVGSFDPLTGQLTPFFNPRVQHWGEHFTLKDAEVIPLTPEARVTVKILRLNDETRILERRRLLTLGGF